MTVLSYAVQYILVAYFIHSSLYFLILYFYLAPLSFLLNFFFFLWLFFKWGIGCSYLHWWENVSLTLLFCYSAPHSHSLWLCGTWLLCLSGSCIYTEGQVWRFLLTGNTRKTRKNKCRFGEDSALSMSLLRDDDAKIITGGLWPSNRRGPSGFPSPRDRVFWRPQNPKCCGPAPSLWPSLFLPHPLCFDPDALASSLLIVNPNHDPTSGPLYLLLSGMFLTQALCGLFHCIWTSFHTSPHLFSEVPFSPTHHSLVIYSAIYCLSFLNKAYPTCDMCLFILSRI